MSLVAVIAQVGSTNIPTISSNATGRFFSFNPANGVMTPLSSLIFPSGTATIGDKNWTWTFYEGNTKITYVYILSQTLPNLFRMQLI